MADYSNPLSYLQDASANGSQLSPIGQGGPIAPNGYGAYLSGQMGEAGLAQIPNMLKQQDMATQSQGLDLLNKQLDMPQIAAERELKTAKSKSSLQYYLTDLPAQLDKSTAITDLSNQKMTQFKNHLNERLAQGGEAESLSEYLSRAGGEAGIPPGLDSEVRSRWSNAGMKDLPESPMEARQVIDGVAGLHKFSAPRIQMQLESLIKQEEIKTKGGFGVKEAEIRAEAEKYAADKRASAEKNLNPIAAAQAKLASSDDEDPYKNLSSGEAELILSDRIQRANAMNPNNYQQMQDKLNSIKRSGLPIAEQQKAAAEAQIEYHKNIVGPSYERLVQKAYGTKSGAPVAKPMAPQSKQDAEEGISRVMSNNKGATREQAIQALQKAGKLPADYQ